MEQTNAVPPPLPVEFEAAGFWVRAGAVLVDMLVLLPAALPLGMLSKRFGGGIWTGIAIGAALKVSYQTFMVGRWGRTLGKSAAGVRVVAMDGSEPGYGRALRRALGYQVSGLVGDLGFLVAAVAPEKRALHDYLAGTRVVFTPAATRGRRVAMTVLGAAFPLVGVVAVVILFGAGVALGFQSAAEQNGDYASAAQLDGVMLRLAPKNAVYWNNRCWHRGLAGQLSDALDDCDESLALAKSPNAYDSRGMVLLKMKRFEESRASYDSALALDPKAVYSLYGRALAREALGDRAGRDADLAAARSADAKIDEAFRKFGLTPAAP